MPSNRNYNIFILLLRMEVEMAIEDYIGKDIPTHIPFNRRVKRGEPKKDSFLNHKQQFLSSKGHEEAHDDDIWEATTNSSAKKNPNSDQNNDFDAQDRQVGVVESS
jgi:hypothetical protein